MTIAQALKLLPRLEAEILLAHCLKLKRVELYTKAKTSLTEAELSQFQALILRRSQHEPIAYIVKSQPFMGLDFYVDSNVLIPRPETELLVETVIELVKMSQVAIADIGTGCGCIAISLAKYLPKAKVIGIDSSLAALEIAQKNAEANGVADRCEFRLGNLFEPLNNVGAAFMAARNLRTGTSPVPTSRPEKFDLIVSNPPYIPTAKIDKLEPDVKNFEPRVALDGGSDGLDYIKRLITQAPNFLESHKPIGPQAYRPIGLIIEIGYDQGPAVKKLAEETKKYSKIEVIKDLSGHDRILKLITK